MRLRLRLTRENHHRVRAEDGTALSQEVSEVASSVTNEG